MCIVINSYINKSVYIYIQYCICFYVYTHAPHGVGWHGASTARLGCAGLEAWCDAELKTNKATREEMPGPSREDRPRHAMGKIRILVDNGWFWLVNNGG